MKEEQVCVRFDLNKRMVYLHFGRLRQKLRDERDYHLINILSLLYAKLLVMYLHIKGDGGNSDANYDP
jgi:hypothetical protein